MIKINNDYYVDVDTYNWILIKRRKAETGKNKGEYVYDSWKFFPSLESLLVYVKKLKDKKLASQHDNLEKYIQELSVETDKYIKEIHKFCDGIKKGDIK